MGRTSRKIQNKILIADILQHGLTESNLPIIIDSLSMEKNEESDLLLFTLESMEQITPALKIVILQYKLAALKNYLNLTPEAYIEKQEKDLIYIKTPRKNYIPLSEEQALKQIFKIPSIKYPIIGETKSLSEEIEFFDENDGIWKRCIRNYIINDSGRVVQFLSERIIDIPYRPAPTYTEDFTYSFLGKEFFDKKITEEDLLNE